jgi:DnaJ-class molecular chaperone
MKIQSKHKTGPCPECDGTGLLDMERWAGSLAREPDYYEGNCPECTGLGEIELVCEACWEYLAPSDMGELCTKCEDEAEGRAHDGNV